MNEVELLELVYEGENFRIEFKRELDLSSARKRAEFIKDIIALANSANDIGYLIIGVDKNKSFVGFDQIEEEQYQQVVSSHIAPVVQLNCFMVNMQSLSLSLGVIEVRPTKKPHRCARAIEHIAQNRVFVRRGSVVEEATPEEVIQWDREAQARYRIQDYVRAAEIHARLGNIDNAIRAYDEAIQLAPSHELFLARGDLHRALYYETRYTTESTKWEQLAFKDYSDALALTTSSEIEKVTRLKRWHVFCPPEPLDLESSSNISDEEFKWLQANLAERDLGEALYVHIKATSDNITLFEQYDAADTLIRILELGYREPDVYALRANAYYLECNYGLALKDIDTAIQLLQGNARMLSEYHYLRANILCSMRSRDSSRAYEPYEKAVRSITEARRLAPKAYDPYGYIASHFEIEILYTYALAEYSKTIDKYDRPIAQAIMRHVILLFGGVARRFPSIVSPIIDLVGEDFWQANRSRLAE
jgi:tetratricopeptide (TPR) repeat protein